MVSFHIKPGQYFTIGGHVVLQITEDEDYGFQLAVDAPEDVSVTRGRRKSAGKRYPKGPAPAASVEELRTRFSGLVKELAAAMPPAGTLEWREQTGDLLSELTFALAEQANRQKRKACQAEGIAAAKADGVQFGRKRNPLPENFEEMRLAWHAEQLSLKEAADGCGMSASSFYRAARRVEGRGDADTGAEARENHSTRLSQGAPRSKVGVGIV